MGMGGNGNLSKTSSGNSSSGSMSGGSKHTLSEERDNKKGGSDVAEIIDSGAGGLESITGFISSFTGKGPTNSNTNYSPPPPEKKTNPLLIGGIVAGVFLLIIVLILTKNGQAKQ